MRQRESLRWQKVRLLHRLEPGGAIRRPTEYSAHCPAKAYRHFVRETAPGWPESKLVQSDKSTNRSDARGWRWRSGSHPTERYIDRIAAVQPGAPVAVRQAGQLGARFGVQPQGVRKMYCCRCRPLLRQRARVQQPAGRPGWVGYGCRHSPADQS